MKVLVLGAYGMLGHRLSLELGRQERATVNCRRPIEDGTVSGLMSVPDGSIAQACAELKRVTKRPIDLNEGRNRNLVRYLGGLACEQPLRVPQETEMEVGLQ